MQIETGMKKHLLLVLWISVLGFSSCIKNNPDPYQEAQEQLDKDEVIIKKFIADHDIPAIRHESGLYYQIIEPGTGSVNYTASTAVTAKYTGRLLNGNVFDTSTFTSPNPLGKLIVGWQIGIPLIQQGGKIRLIIPSGYAYGKPGSGAVPSNAVLDFDIELLKVD